MKKQFFRTLLTSFISLILFPFCSFALNSHYRGTAYESYKKVGHCKVNITGDNKAFYFEFSHPTYPGKNSIVAPFDKLFHHEAIPSNWLNFDIEPDTFTNLHRLRFRYKIGADGKITSIDQVNIVKRDWRWLLRATSYSCENDLGSKE